MKKKDRLTIADTGRMIRLIMLVALIIGLSFWFGMLYEEEKSFKPNIVSAEKYYHAAVEGRVPYVYRFINENMTIREAYGVYESFKPMSTAVLEYEMRKICAGADTYD